MMAALGLPSWPLGGHKTQDPSGGGGVMYQYALKTRHVMFLFINVIIVIGGSQARQSRAVEWGD
jgi:hypothetical protein